MAFLSNWTILSVSKWLQFLLTVSSELRISYHLRKSSKWLVRSDKLRDCQQITFVTFNRFCPLSNTPPPLPSPPFLMDNIKMDRIPTKIKWKIHQIKSKISKKNIFVKIFLFNSFAQTPTLNDQNPLSKTSFLLMLPLKICLQH